MTNNKSTNTNQFVDFIPHFKKQEEEFEKNKFREYTYKENIPKLVSERGWPRPKPVIQIAYENFMSKIVDPISNTFYPEKDENGYSIPQRDGKPNARHIINSIVRVRRAVDKKEYLYTMGAFIGFEASGSPVTCQANAPEKWEKTIFANVRKYDQNTNSFVQECLGPRGHETVYELPFTPENLDMLMEKAVINNLRYSALSAGFNNSNSKLNFVVHDEQNERKVSVEWSSLEDTLKLFKEKDFEFLFNANYIPPQVKAEIREISRGLTGEKDNDPSGSYHGDSSSDNQNFKGYTL